MRRIIAASLVSLVGCASVPSRAPPAAAAEIVFVGGVVATMDPARPRAEALAVRGERIVFVGSRREVERLVGERTRVVDLHGGMLLPGFHDSHVHPVTATLAQDGCRLDGSRTREAVLAKVAECARARPDAPWIVGRGWRGGMFPDANPRREWLDAVVGDRAVALISTDGHSTWASSKALAVGGVGRETRDPPMGRIERDRDGSPSGTLRDTAAALVRRHLPAPTPSEREDAVRRAIATANSEGITSLVDASVDEPLLRAYLAVDHKGELTATVTAALQVNPERDGEVARVARLRALGTEHVRADMAKLFADGVVNGRTAALLAPYRDGTHGSLVAPAKLARLVTELARDGVQVHIHAVGDAAVRAALDAFQAARADSGGRDLRHGIAHLALVAPDDAPRFRALGVVAVVQPLWGAWAPGSRARLEALIDAERAADRMPVASLARAGALLAAGSDWPVTALRPLDAIEVAVTRRPLGRVDAAPLGVAQALDLAAALAAYTVGGAYFAHDERESGTLTAGKRADLVVLDRDLATLPPHRIHEARVVRTLVRGREVFSGRAEAPQSDGEGGDPAADGKPGEPIGAPPGL